MRYLPVAIAVMALCLSTAAIAGPNASTSLVMHSLTTGFGPCDIADPCPNPTVNVGTGSSEFVYLIAKNYDSIAGVQTAFDFGGWTFLFGLWDCQSNQVNGTVPAPPGGATSGTIATAFDCISGGAGAVIGRFNAIATGECITQVQSSFPFGPHVVSCTGEVDQTGHAPGPGPVCVGTPGNNASEPLSGPTPYEPSPWGGTQAQYTSRKPPSTGELAPGEPR